jgi:hypothetical protein
VGKDQIPLRFFKRRTKVKPSLMFMCLGEHVYGEDDGNITSLGSRRGPLQSNVPEEYPEGVSEGDSKC